MGMNLSKSNVCLGCQTRLYPTLQYLLVIHIWNQIEFLITLISFFGRYSENQKTVQQKDEI